MRGFAEATEPKAAVRTATSAAVKEALGRHPPPCPILSLDTASPLPHRTPLEDLDVCPASNREDS